MKKTLSVICVMLLAALTLCACGSRIKTPSHACGGSWERIDIPSSVNFKEATIDITDDSFTYTLTSDKSTIVYTGTAKTTGDKSMVLNISKMKQVNNADNKVLQEKTIEQSESDATPAYAQLNDAGNLVLRLDTVEAEFRRK